MSHTLDIMHHTYVLGERWLVLMCDAAFLHVHCLYESVDLRTYASKIFILANATQFLKFTYCTSVHMYIRSPVVLIIVLRM